MGEPERETRIRAALQDETGYRKGGGYHPVHPDVISCRPPPYPPKPWRRRKAAESCFPFLRVRAPSVDEVTLVGCRRPAIMD